MRTLTRALVSLVVLSWIPQLAGAQSAIGGMAGRVESRQIRDRGEDSGTRTGALVGAFIDVETPVGPLSVLAEAFYAQRGGRFDLAGTAGFQGQVQADVLGFTVAPTLHAGIGPLSVYAYGGPMLETPVRTRSTGELSPAYRNPAGQVFAVTGGGGLAVRAGVWSVRIEARVVEELSAAFSGDAGDFRHRSKEILVRVGRIVVR
jgi:hypothetical protein